MYGTASNFIELFREVHWNAQLSCVCMVEYGDCIETKVNFLLYALPVASNISVCSHAQFL